MVLFHFPDVPFWLLFLLGLDFCLDNGVPASVSGNALELSASSDAFDAMLTLWPRA